MTELSPQAQAVLSAWAKPVDIDRSLVVNGQALEAQARGALAAALRASADQWRNEVREQPNTEFICGIKNCIDALNEIAAELEGSDG